MPRKGKGLSNGVSISYGGRGLRRRIAPSQTVRLNKSARQIASAKKLQWDHLAALSFSECEELLNLNLTGNSDSNNLMEVDDWEDMEDPEFRPPPGDEGFLQSHAGGEAILHKILDGMTPKKTGDLRTRKDRTQERVNAWRRQLPFLTAAYLSWKHEGPPSMRDESESGPGSCGDAWSLLTMSFTARQPATFSHTSTARSVNETLASYGFLGGSPEKPVIAFSFSLFEIYRQIHRVCPRFSIYALTKSLCHLHQISDDFSLADQLSTAYDCYLEVMHEVTQRVDLALGRSPRWQQQNVCVPCLYKTIEEPPLKFSLLACMDGNNSLKLVDSTFRSGTPRTDDRVSASLRWITPEEVDCFKDEVLKTCVPPCEASSDHKSPPERLSTSESVISNLVPTNTLASINTAEDTAAEPDLDDPEQIAWLNVAEHDELAKCLDTCVDRWRNASPEARKKMYALFAIAGIFLAVCRHGHVLAMCDMIRSGELMKYPIAIVDRLLELYGSDIGLAYDIMCAFIKTVTRSSLGAKVVGLCMHGVVPAFHGHAHNRGCQTNWLPLYVEGAGLEDFEECERTFSKSNELASITRLTTPFHRQQQIDEHFKFHDDDKHASSGNFIYQNYRQALEKIQYDGEKLAVLSSQLEATSADYESYLQSERDYLKSLQMEPIEITQAINYMELLIKLYHLQQQSDEAKLAWNRLDYDIIHNGFTRTQIANVRTRYCTMHSRWTAYNEEVCRYEEEHKIETRWVPDSPEYNDALRLCTERKYRWAVDKLERLVVQHLFEMTKLGMNGVGYKLREKMGKALKTRAEAIRRALNDYNEAAAQLDHPRDRLTWEKVINAVTLADFDVLRDTRMDIRSLPWTQPARREAMNLHFGIVRAREEITRLNVEIRRLLTLMIDDHVDFYRAVTSNLFRNPSLAYELSCQWEYRTRIHTTIARRLRLTSELKGFTGTLLPGSREGRDPNLNCNVPLPPWVDVLGLVEVPGAAVVDASGREELDSGRMDSLDNDDGTLPRELDVDTDLVIQLMERLNTTASLDDIST